MWSNSDFLQCSHSSGIRMTPNPLEISGVASTLLLAQSLPSADAFFLFPIPSSISMNGVSFNWYMPLTPFETVFLCMIMIQIFVLRWLDILPININNIMHGDPSGRKRRAAEEIVTGSVCEDQDKIIEPMFNLLKKLDHYDCFLRALCQLQSQSVSNNGYIFPEDTKRTLNGIQMFGKYNKESCSQSNSIRGIEPFAEAVDYGSKITVNMSNQTICEEKYSSCPISTDDMTHYTGIILNSF